jgi:hypothetical protein
LPEIKFWFLVNRLRSLERKYHLLKSIWIPGRLIYPKSMCRSLFICANLGAFTVLWWRYIWLFSHFDLKWTFYQYITLFALFKKSF